jgi:type II secretory pathway component PulM
MTIALKRNTTLRSRWRQRLTRWVRGPTLARDIAIVLAIKFALLMVLKYTFFNHPQAEHMSLPPEQVAQALLSAPALHSSQGDQHAR